MGLTLHQWKIRCSCLMFRMLIKIKKTKKGSFATSASVLEDLAFKGHKFPQLVLDWRQVSKLKNTYSDSLPEPTRSLYVVVF